MSFLKLGKAEKSGSSSDMYPYDKIWWANQDSNLGPSGYEPGALPTELLARFAKRVELNTHNSLHMSSTEN